MFRKGILFFILTSHTFAHCMHSLKDGFLRRSLSQEDKDRKKDKAYIKNLVLRYKVEPGPTFQLALVDGDLKKVRELLECHKATPGGIIPSFTLATSHYWLGSCNSPDILDELVQAGVDIHRPDPYDNSLLDKCAFTILAGDCGAQFERNGKKSRLGMDVIRSYQVVAHIMTFLLKYASSIYVCRDLPLEVRTDLKKHGIKLQCRFDPSIPKSEAGYLFYQRVKKHGGAFSSIPTSAVYDCGAAKAQKYVLPYLSQFKGNESDEAENK